MNHAWAATIIDQLVQQGVTHFCIAPGKRSAPLILAVAEHPKAKAIVHFDERGLGFHALGLAKACGKPACVIVTSGTAVGNLFPAVMEAKESHTPMILLTCDRPPELRDTSANQTGDQLKIFGDYVLNFFDLPPPSETHPKRFLATTLSQMVLTCQFPIKGPVQLNCPFQEPLIDKSSSEPMSITSLTIPKWSLSEKDTQKWASQLEQIQRGVILIGGQTRVFGVDLLARTLGWPIFCDISSSMRGACGENEITYYPHLLDEPPEAILHFGGAVVSKRLHQWMQGSIIHVSECVKRCDPKHIVTMRILCSPEQFCKQVTPHLKQQSQSWVTQWKEASQNFEDHLYSFFENESRLSEPGVMRTLLEIATAKQAYFFGNSMPIRDADLFFFPKAPCGPIFTNRGLSGIDGNIATCCGIAQHYPVLSVMGDQTLLHDLNSLSLLKQTPYPVHLIVINNGGGGIFSFLFPTHESQDVLDHYFAAAHEKHFESAAMQFGLEYYRAKTSEELQTTLENPNSCLIEVATNREENKKYHLEISNQCSFSSTAF